MAVVEEKEPWETQALYIRVTSWATPSHHSDTQRLHGSQATGYNSLFENEILHAILMYSIITGIVLLYINKTVTLLSFFGLSLVIKPILQKQHMKIKASFSFQ